jgi:hypothetical protein
MHPTFVDIENEFADIGREVEHLARLLARFDAEPVDPHSQAAWEATHICASATEKIYSGFERVMARVASEVDRAPVSHADGWHSALVRRMANPFPDIRSAVISPGCVELLDRLRSFRHRERNSYGFNLDFAIVMLRGQEAVAAFAIFRQDVRSFFSK